MSETNSNSNSNSIENISNKNNKNNSSSSNWWGFVGNTWSSIKETAKDFTDSITEENKETIVKVQETVNREQINHGVNKVNNFIHEAYNKITMEDPEGNLLKQREINETNKIIQSYGSSNPNVTIAKPKRFEKEGVTYTSDPQENKKYALKYKSFLENLLKNTTEDELCLNGRALMQGNHAILMYFKQLVPHDVDEITFWKRYYFWKYQNELREKILNKNLKNSDGNKISNDDDTKNNKNEDTIDVNIDENDEIIDNKLTTQPNTSKNKIENENENITKNIDKTDKNLHIIKNVNISETKIDRKLSNESDIVQTVNDTDDTNETENVEDDQDDSNQSKAKSVTSESWQNVTFTKSVDKISNNKNITNDTENKSQLITPKIEENGIENAFDNDNNDINKDQNNNEINNITNNDVDDVDDDVWGWE